MIYVIVVSLASIGIVSFLSRHGYKTASIAYAVAYLALVGWCATIVGMHLYCNAMAIDSPTVLPLSQVIGLSIWNAIETLGAFDCDTLIVMIGATVALVIVVLTATFVLGTEVRMVLDRVTKRKPRLLRDNGANRNDQLIILRTDKSKDNHKAYLRLCRLMN